MDYEKSYINIDRTCRTCLSASGEMHSLFEKLDIFHQSEVAVVLSQFSITIEKDPCYSDVICGKCFKTIIEFHNFYISYQNSQQLLTKRKLEESEIKREPIEVKCEDPLYLENESNNVVVKIENNEDSPIVGVEIKETNINKFFNHVCPLCWKPFRAIASFIRHMKIHPNTKIRCKNCHKLCMNVDSFLIHYKKEFELRKTWIKKEEKEKRIKNKAAKKLEKNQLKMECKKCQKKFTEYKEFNEHIEKNKCDDDTSNVKKLICPVCIGKPMRTFRSFERHVIKHKNFKCNYCDDTFQQGLDFIEHFKIIHRHQCNLCGEFFSRNIFLQRHLQQHDKNYDPTLQCDYEKCNRKFFTKGSLHKHRAIHHGKKDLTDYLCNICGERCTTYDGMRYHKKKHEGPKYLCSYCGRAFIQSVHLTYHMWRHTGIKPYNCSNCNKSFVSKRLLTSHIKKGCTNDAEDTEFIEPKEEEISKKD